MQNGMNPEMNKSYRWLLDQCRSSISYFFCCFNHGLFVCVRISFCVHIFVCISHSFSLGCCMLGSTSVNACLKDCLQSDLLCVMSSSIPSSASRTDQKTNACFLCWKLTPTKYCLFCILYLPNSIH